MVQKLIDKVVEKIRTKMGKIATGKATEKMGKKVDEKN